MTSTINCAGKYPYCIKKHKELPSDGAKEKSEITIDDQVDEALKKNKSKCTQLVSHTEQDIPEVITAR